MNCKKGMIRKYIAFFTAVAVGSIVCFPTPSMARVIQSDVLTMQITQAEEAPIITSNLLVEGGQTIFLSADKKEMELPITIQCENLEKISYIAGSITAVSSDETRMQVTVDKKAILLYEEGNTIKLTIKMVEPEEPEKEPEENPEETPEKESENVPENNIQPDDSQVTPEAGEGETPPEGEIPPEGETPPEGENPPEGEIPPVTEGEELPPVTEEDESISTPEDETGELDSVAKVNFLNWTFTGTAPENEDENQELFVEVAFIIGEQIYSAKIILQDAVQTADMTGELSFCPSQYHPSGNFVIKGNSEMNCIVSGFPAMTKYVVNEQTYLLYSGGSIAIPAKEDVMIDLSKTGIHTDLILDAGGEEAHTVKYVELPEYLEENEPLVLGEEGGSLPISLIWGNLEATITIEHLTMAETEIVWESAENVKATVDENGNLQITPKEAMAGTYRAVASWNESGITLNRMEIPFFIQYTGTYQGGIGNDQ